jgi:Tripartite tricarboxylate transporter TctB family
LRIKSERDFWSGFVFVVAGIAFALGATDYGMGPACPGDDACTASLWARFTQLSTRPGAGYFPLCLGVLLAFVGALVLFKALAFESEGGDAIGSLAWRPLLAVVGAIIAFAALLEPIGLVGSVLVLVGLASLADEERQWKGVVAAAALLTLAALLLVHFLRLALPLWPAGLG